MDLTKDDLFCFSFSKEKRVIYLSKYDQISQCSLTMFRNVTGVQEAVVHRQSEDSLIHEKHQIKLIKDVQSDDIARTYPILKTKWIHERQDLIDHLKHLQTRQGLPEEIQRMKNLIACFNELIEHGEVSKNCQILMKMNIQPAPETYVLTKKPLGDKMIRLPRHISKTTINLANPFKKITSEILHRQRSNEKLGHQTEDSNEQEIDHQTIDTDQTTMSSVSTEKMKNGLQFYVVAEPFRHQKAPRKKHYFTSSIIE